jgi:hypothetical protein
MEGIGWLAREGGGGREEKIHGEPELGEVTLSAKTRGGLGEQRAKLRGVIRPKRIYNF